ncbi:MAG TPA: VanZ family protein [Terracidiphilus sp.]|nr:VanZ family protein [Terracidiphilus sp.]
MVADTPHPPRRNPWLYAWLPVLIGTALIATSSTPYFSAKDTSTPFRWVYEGLFGHVSNDHWGRIHFYIRKTGHFVGYGVFGLLWLRAWWLSLPRSRFLHDAALAVLGAGLVASADEFHQHFLPSRTGSPWDVLLDCSGALSVQLVVYIFLRIFRPKKLARAL